MLSELCGIATPKLAALLGLNVHEHSKQEILEYAWRRKALYQEVQWELKQLELRLAGIRNLKRLEQAKDELQTLMELLQ